MEPSSRALLAGESATLAVSARAARMRAEGLDVISLGAGEPDAPTPAPIAEAGIAAIRAGHTRYTPAAGLPEAREAVCAALERDFGLRYGPEEVLVTAGAKPAITLALLCLLEPGDRVVLPAPYWVSYPDIVGVLGGEVLELAPVPSRGFVHSGEEVARACAAEGVRGILHNSPNNPSGAVHTPRQVEDLVAAAQAHGLWIVSDEIYGRILYDEARHVSPAAVPGGRERTLVVNGPSKTFAMTGWRLGFLAGPSPIIEAAARVQSQLTGNTSTPGQHALVEACGKDHEAEFAPLLRAFEARRALVLEELARVPGLGHFPPRGAFYVLLDVREAARRRGLDDVELALRLLEEARVALVPGSAFGIPGHLRLSFAASEQELREGIARLAGWMAAP